MQENKENKIKLTIIMKVVGNTQHSPTIKQLKTSTKEADQEFQAFSWLDNWQSYPLHSKNICHKHLLNAYN